MWDSSLYSSDNYEDGFCDYAGNSFRCACNHICSPANLYIISNLESKQNILIGCDCAEKTGFIEPEKIKMLEKKRNMDPIYKNFLEESKKKNESIYFEKIKEGLKAFGETIENVSKNYLYIGGNYDKHLIYYNNNHMKNMRKNICELISDECACSCFSRKLLLLLCKKETITLCKKCCSFLGKFPGKTCEDCCKTHRNRSDNYCNDCREKTNCIKCNKRDICVDEHCSECLKKYIFCKDCNINTVTKEGYRCSNCYNRLKKCECGKIILKRTYSSCWNCYNASLESIQNT
jgi:hypothetical protein